SRKLYCEGLAFAHRDDWAVMCLPELEPLRLNTLVSLHADRIGPFDCRPISRGVPIPQRILRVVESLYENFDYVWIIYLITPADIFVVPNRRVRRAEERGAAEVPPLFAMNVPFVPLAGTKERLMWIDEQQRVAAHALGRRDGPHVRADHGFTFRLLD